MTQIALYLVVQLHHFTLSGSIVSLFPLYNLPHRPANSKLINNSDLLQEKLQFETFQNGKKKIKKFIRGHGLMVEDVIHNYKHALIIINRLSLRLSEEPWDQLLHPSQS